MRKPWRVRGTMRDLQGAPVAHVVRRFATRHDAQRARRLMQADGYDVRVTKCAHT